MGLSLDSPRSSAPRRSALAASSSSAAAAAAAGPHLSGVGGSVSVSAGAAVTAAAAMTRSNSISASTVGHGRIDVNFVPFVVLARLLVSSTIHIDT